MQLMMYLGNDLIETVALNNRELSVPGYLGRFKRYLKIKYNHLIVETGQQPEYLVVPPANVQQKTQRSVN